MPPITVPSDTFISERQAPDLHQCSWPDFIIYLIIQKVLYQAETFGVLLETEKNSHTSVMNQVTVIRCTHHIFYIVMSLQIAIADPDTQELESNTSVCQVLQCTLT